MWKTGTLWSFRNEAKVYGSPMVDGAWHELTGECRNPMPELIQALKDAKVPYGKNALNGNPASATAEPGKQRRSKGSNSKNSDIYVTFP